MYQDAAIAIHAPFPDHLPSDGNELFVDRPKRQNDKITDKGGTELSEFTQPRIAFGVVTAFRRHPHINNVLTHISCSNWDSVERALLIIFGPLTEVGDLSPLAENVMILMCGEHGITGRILKPYFRNVLEALLPSQEAERLIEHVKHLFAESGAWRRRAESGAQDALGKAAQ